MKENLTNYECLECNGLGCLECQNTGNYIALEMTQDEAKRLRKVYEKMFGKKLPISDDDIMVVNDLLANCAHVEGNEDFANLLNK